jgi:4-diphosphocytidyl-2-C-methyl-D-erythritol kinase
VIRAYAKINLGLLVRERRPDGYHNIETVFHRVDVFDEITFAPSPEIVLVSSSDEIPGDNRNICFQAADLLRRELGIHEGVRISIRKNIPVGAGLGGGSSDAAAVLRHLPPFWNKSVDIQALEAFALQLGSDVPYFLRKGSAIAVGRGEVLEYFTLDVPYTILLCHPGTHISTSWAYQQVVPRVQHIDLKNAVKEGMRTPSKLDLGVCNDFEKPVFESYPHIKGVKELMLQGGAVFALMSGSGSSVFGLFPRPDDAERVRLTLRARHYRTFFTPPHFVPDEP